MAPQFILCQASEKSVSPLSTLTRTSATTDSIHRYQSRDSNSHGQNDTWLGARKEVE